jgi:hypothetical protein
MQSKLKSRLAVLEKTMRGRQPAEALEQSPALLVASRLAAMGIEREPTESLAETVAHTMGITMRDLRAKLWLLANGS